MENKILIQVDRVYGNITLRPMNEAATLLAEIAGTKTLTNRTLALAERMGFTIESTGLPWSCTPYVVDSNTVNRRTKGQG